MSKNRYYSKKIFGLIVVLIIGVFQYFSSTRSEEVVKLNRSIDGDTTEFIVNGNKVKVRYLLIDTPETVKPNTPVQPFGKEASDRTKELLTHAKNIELKSDVHNSKDKYGRMLAYVYIDNELLQEILVREGLARVAYIDKNADKQILNILSKEQENAQKQKIGIWSIEGYVTPSGFNP